jgi:hypothetical protein
MTSPLGGIKGASTGSPLSRPWSHSARRDPACARSWISKRAAARAEGENRKLTVFAAAALALVLTSAIGVLAGAGPSPDREPALALDRCRPGIRRNRPLDHLARVIRRLNLTAWQ